MPIVHILSSGVDFEASIPGRDGCIFWRDDLTNGPVPSATKLENLSPVREEFWGRPTPLQRLGYRKTPGLYLDLSIRDKRIRDIGGDCEVVIWRGANRRDFLMQQALLSFLDPELVETGRVSVVPCGLRGPRAYDSAGLTKFFTARSVAGPDLAALPRETWASYTAPDPMALNALAARLRNSCESPADAILSLVLEEYPALDSGLSQIELDMLRLVEEVHTVARIVGHTMGNRKDAVGDWMLCNRIWEFLSGDAPVLELANGAQPSGINNARDFAAAIVNLTSHGHRLLKGQADYVADNGVDRWVGGVHLLGRSVLWRYDAATRRLARSL